MRNATKKAVRSRPRLTVDISPALKRRIKVAAAAQDVPVSAYIANVLDRVVPAAETVAKGSDGTIASPKIRPISFARLASSVTLNHERRNCRRRKPRTQMGARRTL